jgi:hypothetical protein
MHPAPGLPGQTSRFRSLLFWVIGLVGFLAVALVVTHIGSCKKWPNWCDRPVPTGYPASGVDRRGDARVDPAAESIGSFMCAGCDRPPATFYLS